MYCKECGTKIDDNAKFCPSCGTKNESVSLPPQQTSEIAVHPNNKTANGQDFYCTNCGENIGTSKKCKKCQMKSTKNAKKYCRYCGNKIENKKCISCNTSSSNGIIETFFRIISITLIAISFFGAIVNLLTGGSFPVILILFMVPLLLCIFVIRKKQICKIKKILIQKNKNVLWVVVAYILVSIIVIWTINLSTSATFTSNTEDIAIEYSEQMLKNQLKNPDSLVLNDVLVEDSFSDSDWDYFYIVLDYSAQNGFGGYNRDTFEIYLKISKSTNKATAITPLDFTINKYS